MHGAGFHAEFAEETLNTFHGPLAGKGEVSTFRKSLFLVYKSSPKDEWSGCSVHREIHLHTHKHAY